MVSKPAKIQTAYNDLRFEIQTNFTVFTAHKSFKVEWLDDVMPLDDCFIIQNFIVFIDKTKTVLSVSGMIGQI